MSSLEEIEGNIWKNHVGKEKTMFADITHEDLAYLVLQARLYKRLLKNMKELEKDYLRIETENQRYKQALEKARIHLLNEKLCIESCAENAYGTIVKALKGDEVE